MRAYLIVRDDYTLYDKSFQIGEYVMFENSELLNIANESTQKSHSIITMAK